MLAMQEMEAEEELARQRSALASTPGGNRMDAANGGFGDSDLFESLADPEQTEQGGAGPSTARRARLSSIDFGPADEGIDTRPAQTLPSASRTSAAGSAESLQRSVLQQPKCHLPALRAETASGRMLYIKRRYKPLPRPLPVRCCFRFGILLARATSAVQADPAARGAQQRQHWPQPPQSAPCGAAEGSAGPARSAKSQRVRPPAGPRYCRGQS